MAANAKPVGAVTSFRKKGADSINIKGTRISALNAQLLTSTGSPTLDFFIGGGLAIGTICLLEEDPYNGYSSVLFKYFLAEGVINKHALFVSSGDRPADIILQDLPSVDLPEIKKELSVKPSPDNDLKIAWRYQTQSPSRQPSNSGPNCQGHYFNFLKNISIKELESCPIVTFHPIEDCKESSPFLDAPYVTLLQKLKVNLSDLSLRTSEKLCDNIMRVGICGLGSPMWTSNCNGDDRGVQLLRFLYVLKSILRTSFAVAFITVPEFLLQSDSLKSRIREMADYVLRLESFAGSDQKSNPVFGEYKGLLHIEKLPVLNTHVCPTRTSDLGFKFLKKGFQFERLHLPPELGDPPAESVPGCSGLPPKLDF